MIRAMALRRLVFAAAMSVLPASALAQALAYVDTNALNMRVGPSVSYERITSLRGGTRVFVHGYTGDGRWCDVSVPAYDDLRGWVWCDYVHIEADVVGPVTTWGPALGVPIIIFSFDDYHDRHYRYRPLFRDRDDDDGDRPRRRVRVKDRDDDDGDRPRRRVRVKDRDDDDGDRPRRRVRAKDRDDDDDDDCRPRERRCD